MSPASDGGHFANGPGYSGSRSRTGAGNGASGQRPSLLMLQLAPWRKRVMAVMNSLYFYWLLVFLTFFIIFVDDFKKAVLPPSCDLPLEITTTCVLVVFIIEMGERRRMRACMCCVLWSPTYTHKRFCEPIFTFINPCKLPALSSLLRPGYFLGFYFWLDAIATCSLAFEVPTVRLKFFGGSEYINLADRGGFTDNAGDQLYISSKAARVARVSWTLKR